MIAQNHSTTAHHLLMRGQKNSPFNQVIGLIIAASSFSGIANAEEKKNYSNGSDAARGNEKNTRKLGVIMFFNKFIRLLTITALLSVSIISHADTTLVAVAANFTKPMTELAEVFEKTTGHSAKLSFGSSGKFVTQIENGAPFEVFLAADDKSPAKLQQDGFAVEKSNFTYAIGKLVLWSATANLVDDKGEILNKGGFKHLALADPKLAPYGEAAIEVLKSQNLLDKLQPLFVKGENISQTYQFVSTGNAELGFVALSQAIDTPTGSMWKIPENLYSPLRQDVVLLKKGEGNPAASALLAFLKSPEAKAIIAKYGYGLAD